MSIFGLNIVSSPLATKPGWEVRRHPTKKRRRQWTVAAVTKPACYQIGNTFYMHPDLVAMLPKKDQPHGEVRS